MHKDYNPTLVLNVLRRDFPDIAVRIFEGIKSEIIDDTLKDYDHMPTIITDYCRLINIDSPQSWINQPSQSRITNEREILLAIIIKLYQPEKITGLLNKRVKNGIVKSLAKHMKCPKDLISRSISDAINNYKIYTDFKNEVDTLHDRLKNKYNGWIEH